MTNIQNPQSLLQFSRHDTAAVSRLVVDINQHGPKMPPSILGSFLEHLAFSMSCGLPAQLLLNPTFHREHNLKSRQLEELVINGQLLVRLYLSGSDPAVFRHGWNYIPLQTGFGVGVLDDATKQGLPLGWGPMGYPRAVSASTGRVGDAVRLKGGDWSSDPKERWPVLEDGPAGVRQGVFLPIRRCLTYQGELWVRIGTLSPQAYGEVEVGFRRRVATPDGHRHAGEHLAATRIPVSGAEWVKVAFQLDLSEGQVAFGEPVDFYVRWLPRSQTTLNLLIDRAELFPTDADDGLDPEVVRLAREWPAPLLRWPGGNFVSHYHWRDGIGPVDLRPTRPNYAWGGLEYNTFGTDEFIRFCRKIGAQPHITVNAATGSPEEAAAWVEYCNGDASTPMGQLRARNGHPEPYNVRLWEVGNEHFGTWQGGYHGSDENARRFAEFAPLMRQASPIPIELIACGNGFDFADPVLGYDHTHADGRWHDQLLKQAADQIDYISLHSMPVNDLFLENVTDEQAHNAVLGQVATWERKFLPDLLARCDQATPASRSKPIRLAVTEWGPVGLHPNRVMVENFGGVVYAGAFLNLLIRNAARIPIANTTGFMHGGCIHKAYGVVYYDPQYLAIQQYAPFIGAQPLACHLTGGGYDITQPADIGAADTDIPWLDAIVCQAENGAGLLAAIANRSLTQALSLEIEIPSYRWPAQVEVNTMAYPDITARANPIQFEQFRPQHRTLTPSGETLRLTLQPFSVSWLKL
ncbi:MAG: hypothetical protein U0350_21540 [Caldilineaceae bacterium]